MNKRMLLIIMTLSSISLQAANQTDAKMHLKLIALEVASKGMSVDAIPGIWQDLYKNIELQIEREEEFKFDNERKQLLSDIITNMDTISKLAQSPENSLSAPAHAIMNGFVVNAVLLVDTSADHDELWPTQENLTYLETYTEQMLGLKKTAENVQQTHKDHQALEQQTDRFMKVIVIGGITRFAIKTAQDKDLCSIQ